MSDCADDSDQLIEAVVARGRAKVERDLANNRLRPIITELDGVRFGTCHWCESPINPGTLFCQRDPNDVGMSCSEMSDHEHKRHKEMGI